MSSIYDFNEINKRIEEMKQKPKPCWYCNGKGLVPDMSDPLKSNFCHLCGGSGLAKDHPADAPMEAQPTQGVRPAAQPKLMTAHFEQWGTPPHHTNMIVVRKLGTTEAWAIPPGSPADIEDFINWLRS